MLAITAIIVQMLFECFEVIGVKNYLRKTFAGVKGCMRVQRLLLLIRKSGKVFDSKL